LAGGPFCIGMSSGDGLKSMQDTDRICLLLVEDDVLVRMTVAMMLEDDGFKVVEASTAAEAQRLMQGGLNAAVMVTDVDLGAGPSGMELADELRTQRPDLAIIFITGRLASMAGRRLNLREAVLPKPFDGGALSRLVREMTPR
jgi:DNA-binding response OmpR family regulator